MGFPEQHVCCAANAGPGRGGVEAVLPEAWNHSAMQRVNCTNIEEPVPKKMRATKSGFTQENVHLTRSGTSCSYCLCLYDDGESFVEPPCCSVKDFGKPGINKVSGYPICQTHKTTYNLKTGFMRACALRYDLYAFGKANSGRPLARPGPCVLTLIAALGLSLAFWPDLTTERIYASRKK